MAFLSSIFCCFPTTSKKDSQSSSQSANHGPFDAANHQDNSNVQRDSSMDDSYWPTCALPRYTERPMSLYEKTIVFGRGSNPQLGNENGPRDEKRQQDFNDTTTTTPPANEPSPQNENHPGPNNNNNNEDHHSDASSTYSFPSSLGNTSTATRVTPPPPYSATTSRAASQRTRSLSLTGTDIARAHMEYAESNAPMTPQLRQPQPVYRPHYPERWIAQNPSEIRASWDSERPLPPVPPTYSRE